MKPWHCWSCLRHQAADNFDFSLSLKAFWFTWSSSYAHLNFGSSSHKFLHINQFMFNFFPAGGSPSIYALETHTKYKMFTHTQKQKQIFCSGQINSWTFIPWLMDNSWKLRMHETLRACVFTSTWRMCACACVHVCAHVHLCVRVFCYWQAAVLRVNFNRWLLACI